jgi:hypothetical protein
MTALFHRRSYTTSRGTGDPPEVEVRVTAGIAPANMAIATVMEDFADGPWWGTLIENAVG